MAGQVQLDAWLPPETHSETHSGLGLLDDSLLRELSAELGGNPNPPAAGSGCTTQGQQQLQHNSQAAGPAQQQQQHVVPLHPQQQLRHAASVPVGAQFLGASDMQQVLSLLHSQNSLPMGANTQQQQQQQHFGLAATGFGSAPEHQQALVNSLNSNNNNLGAGLMGGQQQQQVQPMLMYRPAFGGPNAVMATGVMGGGGGKGDGHQQQQAVSKTHSPSNSNSGNQQCGVDDSLMDLYDTQRGANKGAGGGGGGGGAVNKGALAQKRFRERQKEKMRASEAQVAELTRKLGQLEVEKARLSSRTRLLEQVVSLNLLHEAKLHTNREIMVREQEMLLDDLAAFVLQLAAVANGNNSSGSSPNSPEWLQQQQGPAAAGGGGAQQQQQQQGLHIGGDMLMPSLQQQQQQQHMNEQQQLLQQQDVMALLQQQQQQQGQADMAGGQHPSSSSSGSRPHSGQVAGLSQTMRGWTVSHMVDSVFPQYIECLQQLLSRMGSSSPVRGSNGSNAAATTAHQQMEELVLKRREMTDRHALFSHYYWAVWCFNRGDVAAQQLPPPGTQQWAQVLQHLSLSKEQTDAIVSARTSLLTELNRVAADWQRVLPTLALQLLQVPRAQWHTVGAVQAMVTNLAAEREAVVGFLHTLIDEVLTPVQEGELEARSYPWCPDVWAIAGAAAAAQAAAAPKPSAGDAGTGGSGRGKGGRKPAGAAAAAAAAAQQAQPQQGLDEDPMAALAMGTDVLQPLMPFMTAFQLLREPVTAKGAGLRLKRALLLDPFRTVVPAAAYPQPTAAEVYSMSLLDAHCGTFQQVMLWDWLKLNLPSYVSMLGMQTSQQGNGGATTTAPAAAGAIAAAQQPPGFMGGAAVGHHTLQAAAGNPMGQQFWM